MPEVYGGVIVKGVQYLDNDICKINPTQRLLYGVDWVYAGDQFFEESNIAVGEVSFGGRKGLTEFLSYIGQNACA